VQPQNAFGWKEVPQPHDALDCGLFDTTKADFIICGHSRPAGSAQRARASGAAAVGHALRARASDGGRIGAHLILKVDRRSLEQRQRGVVDDDARARVLDNHILFLQLRALLKLEVVLEA